MLQEKSEGDGEYESISEAVRDCIRRSQELESVRAERDDLRRQLRETNRRVDEHQELVEYVEEERSLQQAERERRNAAIWTRAKYWIFGKSD